MAIVDLTSEFPPAVAAAPTSVRPMQFGVHDASRVEWSVTVPLPESKPSKYAFEVELEIPANAFARHVPWDQLQAFARLDGPAMSSGQSDDITLDALRRGAVALASKLSKTSDGFARHCRLAASLFAPLPHSELREALVKWLEAAFLLVAEARAGIAKERVNDAQELARERRLIDEYLSVRLLEMLAGAERAISGVRASRSPLVAELEPTLVEVQALVADALETEVHHRAAKKYVHADPTRPQALERYLDRASQLKKHFQEVLFLEAETYQVADRLKHWVAGAVAVFASTWAFAWQLVLMSRNNGATQLGSGILWVATLGGVIYATKDRIKEVGRGWVSGKLRTAYGAERIARYRAPARRLPRRDVIISARESFEQVSATRVDALNPESGATVPFTRIVYRHQGSVVPQAELRAAGVRRVKHVFRYDLSPLFCRLDDATKPIPVLDEVTHKVRFIDAPRCYRVPITMRVRQEGGTWEDHGVLVLHKHGLDRIDRLEDDDSGRDVLDPDA